QWTPVLEQNKIIAPADYAVEFLVEAFAPGVLRYQISDPVAHQWHASTVQAGDKYLVATRLAFGLDTLEHVISPEDSVAPCWRLVRDGAGLDRAILHRDAAPQNFLDQLATVRAWKGFCGRNHQFQTDLAELIRLCSVDSGKPVEGNGV